MRACEGGIEGVVEVLNRDSRRPIGICIRHWRRGELVQGLGVDCRRVSAEFFLPSPPKCDIWGDDGGLTVFVNFNI